METGGVHHGHDWIVRPDGLILFALKPDMALSVEGSVHNGSSVVLRPHNGKPEPFNQWRWNTNGMLTLADKPNFDLNVKDGKLQNGAPVIVWQTQTAGMHNTWASEAEGAESGSSTTLSTKVPFWIRVVGSRGDPNTLWSSLTGGVSAQAGYVSCSSAMNRDTDSSWMYVHDDYYHSEHVTFVQVPYGSNFILKAVEKPLSKASKKSNLGYLACTERMDLDRRDAHSTYAYVHKDKSHATQFVEEVCPGGFMLRSLDGHGGYLSCVQQKSEDQNDARSTLLYVQHQYPNLAAVFVAHSTQDGQISFWERYKLAIILCCAITLIASVVLWIIVWLWSWGTVAADVVSTSEPLQINIPYDCLHQPERMWSNAKKAWCCKHNLLGCPTTTPQSTLVPQASNWAGLASRPQTNDDDCYTDVLYWQTAWTLSKQNWCCENHGIGCRASLHSDAYDCEIDYGRGTSTWSYRKKLWCCMHHAQGCPAEYQAGQYASTPKYDCTAGYSEWPNWHGPKKAWCCYHAAVGCPVEKAERYDCDAGYQNWLQGWSQAKKIWCCFHQDRGCDDADNTEYDCVAGYENWQFGWSGRKKDWCCQHEDRGCSESGSEKQQSS
ncbi:unnamed protein product [Symbiodinium pilosum]|uniref:Uncharacterized protein n=1 Tax=Symbiodinium pilosum TaxID=2952 RepID=A0A812U5T5_SYMPI|nr:unnamed protein product [Symbiodinium pilosum]